MFRLAPKKKVLQARDELPELVPEYKPFTFVPVPGMPESLLVLCGSSMLLHLHTNYTQADSVLSVKGAAAPVPDSVQVQYIPLPSLAEAGNTEEWLTLLEVDPKMNVYALLSATGTLLFLKLRVRLQREKESYVAETLKQVSLNEEYSGGSSLCLDGERFFFLETSDRALQVKHCNIETFNVEDTDNEAAVLYLMLKDYNTENNILGCKHGVVFYKEQAIAAVPVGTAVLSVFGIQCNAFQLLVLQKASGNLEWWRWTGTECEAVTIPPEHGVPKGNLVWF